MVILYILTLEEAKYADIIIHVVDCVNPDMDRQMATVYETLEQLEVGDKPIITLFNKCDKLEDSPSAKDLKAKRTVNISAKTGMGLEAFQEALQDIILESRIHIKRCFGYNDAGKIQLIREFGQLISEEYTAGGIEVEAFVPKEVYNKLWRVI